MVKDKIIYKRHKVKHKRLVSNSSVLFRVVAYLQPLQGKARWCKFQHFIQILWQNHLHAASEHFENEKGFLPTKLEKSVSGAIFLSFLYRQKELLVVLLEKQVWTKTSRKMWQTWSCTTAQLRPSSTSHEKALSSPASSTHDEYIQ